MQPGGLHLQPLNLDQSVSGGLLSTQYRFRTDTAEADPGSGRFRYDDAVQANVGEIYISDINDAGKDLSNFLALIAIGDRLYIQDEGDASKFAVWNVVGPAPLDNVGWWTISVVLERDGDVLSQNTRCLVALQVQGTTDLIYLRLDTANDPLTGELTVQNVIPVTPQQRDCGDSVDRFRTVGARLGIFVGESNSSGGVVAPQGAIRTFNGALSTGIMAGNQVRLSSGVTELQLQGGSYKAIATMGNVFSYSTGDARILNTGGGSSVFGSAFSYGAGDAVLSVPGPGCFMNAYAYTGYGATAKNHTLLCSQSGAVLFGYSYGYGQIDITSSGQGSFVQGFWACTNANATSVMRATGGGSFAQGAVANNSTFTSTLEATGEGSMAQGHIAGTGTIRASGDGSFAQGRAMGGGILEASALGAFAHGVATSNDIIASNSGAFAIGDSSGGDIIANQVNSMQLGPGTNSFAVSLQVGVGIHLRANNAGSIFMKEGAAAILDLIAWGQLWVRNDVPNILMFTDDAGNDWIVDVTAA